MRANLGYKKGRRWMGTIWEQKDIEYIKKLKYKYCLISDDDHTEEGQLHWHCLLEFNNPRAFPATETVHWEKPNDIIHAIEYCKNKGQNYFEDGQIEIATNKKEEWEGFVDLCKTASPAELIDSPYSKLYARYMSFAGTVHNTFANLEIINGDLQNLWCYGRPGTGKTKYAYNITNIDNLYIKALNKWWDGYHGQEYVVIDDIDPTHGKWITGLLKQWSDRYPFRAECKGTSMMIRPKCIIVTSNYTIEDICENEIDATALSRRFKKLHFKMLDQIPEEEN